MHAGLTATTLREAYYVDDGLVFDSSELDGMTEWPTPRLHVDQLQSIINTTQIPVNQISSSEPTVTVKQVQDNSDHWILDICLDYFSTYNPFRTQMQALIEVDLNSHRPSISGSYTGRSINSIEGEVCPSVDMIVNCAMDLWRFLLVRSPEYLHSTDTSAPLIRQLHSDSLHALRSLLLSPMPRSDGAVDSNGGSGDDYGDHQKVPLKRPRLNTEIATPSMDSTLNDFYEAVPKLYAPNNWVPIKHSATILRKWLSEPSLR